MQYAKPVTLNVEECDRLSFLPYLFGNDFLYAEAYVYALAQKMMPEYRDTPLVEYTRDRLHRETLRSFGRYELTTAYTPAGQLQSQHLNSLLSDRDYTWNDNGELIRISSPRQTRSYSYSTTGRLTGVHTTAANLDIRIPYATDPAGNGTSKLRKTRKYAQESRAALGIRKINHIKTTF